MDYDKLAAAAVGSFLREDQLRTRESPKSKRRRLGGVGAVALGVGLAVGARAAYRRVRNLDLAQVAGTVEDRLKH
jgi:hypothetical protein